MQVHVVFKAHCCLYVLEMQCRSFHRAIIALREASQLGSRCKNMKTKDPGKSMGIQDLNFQKCFLKFLGNFISKSPFFCTFLGTFKSPHTFIGTIFCPFFALFSVALFWALFCGFCLLFIVLFWALLIASTLFLIKEKQHI